MIKIFEKFLRFLVKRPLVVKFSKFCSESFYRNPDRRVLFKFRKICRREIGEIVRCLPYKNSPGSPAVATARIAPKICQGQPPTMFSDCSRFHPNRFTFGGVIAERVNTAKSNIWLKPSFEPNNIKSNFVRCLPSEKPIILASVNRSRIELVIFLITN